MKIRDFVRLFYFIASGLALLFFVVIVGLVMWDRLRENTWLDDKSMRLIGEKLSKKEPLAGPRESDRKPEEKEPETEKTLDDLARDVVEKARSIQEDSRGSEAGGIGDVSESSLEERIQKSLKELQDAQNAFDINVKEWKDQQDQDKQRIEKLAGSVYLEHMSAVKAKLVARDWKKLYDNKKPGTKEAEQFIRDLAMVFSLLPTRGRTKIAGELDADLHLAITEELRLQAGPELTDRGRGIAP